MAEVNEFDIQGIVCKDPPRPPYKEIRNYGIPKRNQVWSRHTEYEGWDWNTDPEYGPMWYDEPEEGQMEWFEEEISRINNGEWVFIDGVATYFNPWCYFFHQWHTLQSGIYPQYRDTSLEFFRVWHAIDNDPFTLGIIGIKGRRLGMSSMAASVQLRIGLTEKNTLQGIVSKTGTDAKEMYLMIKNSLENLPPFLMPSIRNIGEKEIHLATPRERISKNNQKVNPNKGLNNRLTWLPLAENSYDGRELRCLIIDEAAKYEEANVTKLFSKISETLVTGANVVGKVMMFSTVNAPDKGGANFEILWTQSDHTDKKGLDDIGQTTSRMKRFFTPGYKGVQGYIDYAGNSVVDTPTEDQRDYLKNQKDHRGNPMCANPNIGSKAFRQSRRDALEKAGDTEGLAEEKRKFPFEWQEAFDAANENCLFDMEKLNRREEELKQKLYDSGRDIQKGELGRRGMWARGESGSIHWVDDSKGIVYIDSFLPKGQECQYEIVNGKKVPTNEDFGAAGFDPLGMHQSTAEEGSDACLMVRRRYHGNDPDNSGKPVAMVLGRTDHPDKMHDQVYMTLEYFGIKMLAERAVESWLVYAEDNGLTGYLYATQRKTDGKVVYGIVNQQKESLKEDHAAVQVKASIEDIPKIPFIRLIRDRKFFSTKDRTKYDACMADGYALMALRYYNEKPKKVATKGRKFFMTGRVLNSR